MAGLLLVASVSASEGAVVALKKSVSTNRLLCLVEAWESEAKLQGLSADPEDQGRAQGLRVAAGCVRLLVIRADG